MISARALPIPSVRQNKLSSQILFTIPPGKNINLRLRLHTAGALQAIAMPAREKACVIDNERLRVLDRTNCNARNFLIVRKRRCFAKFWVLNARRYSEDLLQSGIRGRLFGATTEQYATKRTRHRARLKAIVLILL